VDNTGDKQEVRRVIKRYSNRKLYDTRDSRYVTLLQIAEMVRRGEDVQIIDNTTKEDKTEVTLALAISEELKAKPRSVPLGTLRNLIQERGEKILTSLRDGPIGRLIPEGEEEEGAVKEEAKPAEQPQPEAEQEREREKDKPERKTLAELVASSRHTLDQWQHAIDDRIRAVLPNFSLFLDIQTELRRLTQRVQALEERLGQEPPPGTVDKAPDDADSTSEQQAPAEPAEAAPQPEQDPEPRE
jgi:polyhydroxyalkanoate synthesis repressor PhaR